MIQFYAPDIEQNPVLPDEESFHCCKVLRKKEGDLIRVTDGLGKSYLCKITRSHHKETVVEILECQNGETRNYHLTLAVAPTKNTERMEWMAEKAVELGVDRIVLLKCQRSERKNLRIDRLQRIMISAMNQSLETRLPLLEEIIGYNNFIKSVGAESQKFFGYCSERFPRKEFAKECKAGGEIVVMIGPEGDFTPEEVESAIEKGFVPVTFGDKRLRTETAGVFAVCAVAVINQL